MLRVLLPWAYSISCEYWQYSHDIGKVAAACGSNWRPPINGRHYNDSDDDMPALVDIADISDFADSDDDMPPLDDIADISDFADYDDNMPTLEVVDDYLELTDL